ncbi:MAG: PAS domain-containing protein [bacterium]
MNPTLLFDGISLIASLALTAAVVASWRRFYIPTETKILVSLMLLTVIFRSISNVLEWSGISTALDIYEDYTELLLPLIWIFLLISLMHNESKKRLELSEERYRTVTSMTNDFVYSIAIHEDGTIGELWIGGAFEQITGYKIEAINIETSWNQLVHPEDKANAHESLIDALANRKSSCDYRIIRNDGKTIWVHDSRFPVVDPVTKQVVRIYGTVRDATDLFLSSQALNEIENRLNRAQAVAHVGNWEIDLATNAMKASEESYRLYGFKHFEPEMPLKKVQSSVMPEDRPRMDAALRDLLLGKAEYNVRFRIRRANDGAIRHIQSQADIERDALGNPKRVIGTIQDVTELVSLEEQYYQAQKMEAIGQFAGGVAHDINNLITTIIGHTELIHLQLEKGSHEKAKKNLDEILKASERAATLNRRLLTFSRKHDVELRVVSINSVIGNLENLLRRIIGEEIALNVEYSDDNPCTRADVSYLEQIVMNVIVNARDAMPNGGLLNIRTRTRIVKNEMAVGTPEPFSGKYAVITIEDSGTGMTHEQMKHIFEPFFTTKEAGIGTGLGLSTVSGLVKQLDGHVQVESTSGKGTTFHICLPSVNPTELKMESIKTTPLASHGNEVILFVEDDDAVRKLATSILRTHGYHVYDAAHAHEAIEIAGTLKEKPDLIITDVVMPDIRGPEMILELRKIWPMVKALYISGYEARSNNLIPDDAPFLRKPFTVHSLTAAVREILDGTPL